MSAAENPRLRIDCNAALQAAVRKESMHIERVMKLVLFMMQQEKPLRLAEAWHEFVRDYVQLTFPEAVVSRDYLSAFSVYEVLLSLNTAVR